MRSEQAGHWAAVVLRSGFRPLPCAAFNGGAGRWQRWSACGGLLPWAASSPRRTLVIIVDLLDGVWLLRRRLLLAVLVLAEEAGFEGFSLTALGGDGDPLFGLGLVPSIVSRAFFGAFGRATR